MKENENLLAYTVGEVNFNMVKVQGGSFIMGNHAYEDEAPEHRVILDDFLIGQTPVTQALWQAVTGVNPSHFHGDSLLPVECVSWDACWQFIQQLNRLTGQMFLLPTEAEWEYAARGGQNSMGYKYAGSNNIDEVAWYAGNSGSTTHAVAAKKPNELGLYDMSGNVWEWCFDFLAPYPSDTQEDPIGPDFGYYHVLRGGSWGYGDMFCRPTVRNGDFFNAGSFRSGLRLAVREW